jgi:molybdate transport system ATP-binding protein
MKQLHARFLLARPDFSLDVELRLPGSGVSALFGASGSGKTSCLRAIAGLEPQARGYLEVNGAVWQDDAAGFFLPTHRRAIGYVAQDAALFHHLTVQGNLEYGMRRVPLAERRVSLQQAMDLLGIAHLLERKPMTLSGGERQRVAIARALAVSPALLLMDEPLAALDMQRKEEILPYLERLQQELSIPLLYVSHAPDEVARLASYMVLLQQGRQIAAGSPTELMTRLDLPLAHGDSAGVIVAATVADHDAAYDLISLQFAGGILRLPSPARPTGSAVRVRIQARDVSLALQLPQDSSILNSFVASVIDIAPDSPGQVMVALDCNGQRLLARITRKSCEQLKLTAGVTVHAQIKGVALLK